MHWMLLHREETNFTLEQTRLSLLWCLHCSYLSSFVEGGVSAACRGWCHGYLVPHGTQGTISPVIWFPPGLPYRHVRHLHHSDLVPSVIWYPGYHIASDLIPPGVPYPPCITYAPQGFGTPGDMVRTLRVPHYMHVATFLSPGVVPCRPVASQL